MNKQISGSVIILLLATLIALFITIYIGYNIINPLSFLWNTFLVNITFIGDGFFAFGLYLFLVFYFKAKKLASRFLIIMLVTIFTVQLLKNIFNNEALQFFMEDGVNKNDAINYFSYNFISSHTAMAFSLAIFFAMHTKRIAINLLLFSTAALVAYTRVLLVGEAFLAILIGLLPAVCSYFILKHFSFSYFSNKGYFINPKKSRKINSQ